MLKPGVYFKIDQVSTRQFSADLNGNWDGKQLILDERFVWNDGEIQKRQWKINKIDNHNYEGQQGML